MSKNKKLHKLYKNFLIKSLYDDINQWVMVETHDYYNYTYYQITYTDLEIRIDKKCPFDKVMIYNKKSGEKFHFLNMFHFKFNRNLRKGYNKMKSFIMNKNFEEEYQKFFEILPLTEIRKRKLKELLDI